MAGLSAIVFILAAADTTASYCTPCDSCWPSVNVWEEELGSKLSATAELHEVNVSQYETCSAVPTSNMAAWTLLDAENGVCMQHHECAREMCYSSKNWNLPAFTVKVVTEEDISTALNFANEHNIAVSVKTSGHSYHGASTLKGSLLIWMRHFTKFGQVVDNFQDSCGNDTNSSTVKVGGGEVWQEAYSAAGNQYNMIGGGGKTVSAAGGWLQGGGLSAMSPRYGLGIDNVVQFEVIVADGSKKIADACSEPDLFWALRGGGGGTFGVVTSVVYVLHPVTPAIELFAGVNLHSYATKNPDHTQGEALLAWMHKWVDLQQGDGLDHRWGGYWQLGAGYGVMYFVGSEADANHTLIDDLVDWKENILSSTLSRWIEFGVRPMASYFEGTGRAALETDPGSHAQWDADSRLLPRSWVLDNDGETAKAKFTQLVYAGKASFSMYQLGGAVAAVDPAATAVHPAMRAAQWSLISDSATVAMLLDVPGSGYCYNHHGNSEREMDALFGSNLQRLQQVKAAYDPNNRFNCYHCVGFQAMESEEFADCRTNDGSGPDAGDNESGQGSGNTAPINTDLAAAGRVASLLLMGNMALALLAAFQSP